MATAEKTIPTIEDIRARTKLVRATIEAYTKCLDATILDYPIGRNDRGRCRLQVERAKGKGYRTVRTTTDKFGRWCKPRKGIYTGACTVVVTGLGGDRDTRWLTVCDSGVSLTAANLNEVQHLVKAPCHSRPRREPHHYTSRTSSYTYGAPRPEIITESVEVHVIPADPPELCDAYDAWMEECRIIRDIVSQVWDKE